jgi:RHS repeat-associated protein
LTINNAAPTANAGGPYTINEGQGLTLSGSGADQGNDTLTYAWDLDNDGQFDDAMGATPTLTWAQVAALGLPSNGATRSIYLKATDYDGSQSSKVRTTLTIRNLAPTADAGGPYTIDEGEGLNLAGSATDLGNDSLTYFWDLDNDGYYDDATGAAPTLTWVQVAALALRSDGTPHPIHVYAIDSDGLQSSADDTTLTINNRAPTANAGGPYTINEGQGLTLSGSGIDQGNDTLTYAWDLDNDGQFDDATGATPTLTWAQVAAVRQSTDHSPHTILIAVTDSDGAMTSANTTLTILNAAPTVMIGGPDTADEAGTVHYTFITSDVGENSLFSLVSISVTNGDVSNQQFNTSTGSGSFDITFHDGPADSAISVEVQDSDGASSVMLEPFIVSVNNIAPYVDVYGSDDAYEGSVYTLTLGDVHDPAGEYDTIERYQIDWRDGIRNSYTAWEIATLGRQVQHTYADGTIAPTIVVYLWDGDSQEDWYHGADKPITVHNVVPTVKLVGPDNAYEGGTAHYTFTTSDRGNDAFSVVATNGGAVGTVSNETFNGVTGEGSFDVFFRDGSSSTISTVSIQVTDSEDVSNVSSIDVHVANVAPTMEKISGNLLAKVGENYTLTLDPVFDPAGAYDVIGKYIIRWGDGQQDEYDGPGGINPLPSSLQVTHQYQQAGTPTIFVDLIDEDGTYPDVAQLTIGVTSDVDNNVAPSFTSDQVVQAYVGETYHYESTATDLENDRLTFAIGAITWPNGSTPSDGQGFVFLDQDMGLAGGGWDERGIYEWNPSAELAGQTVYVTEMVTDSAHNVVSRTLPIYINPAEGNHDPTIVSVPSTEHWLPISPVPSEDNVTPTYLALSLAENQLSVPYDVSLFVPNETMDVDVVFLVDESGSMAGEHEWLGKVVTGEDLVTHERLFGGLDAELRALGFTAPQYGIVGYGGGNPYPRAVAIGGSAFGTADEFATATTTLTDSGSYEDGYLAIDFSMADVDYDFRPGAVVCLVLVTDEGRTILDGNLDFDVVYDALIREADDTGDDVILHTLVKSDLGAYLNGDLGTEGSFAPVAGRGTWIAQPFAYTGVPTVPDGFALSIESSKIMDWGTIRTSIAPTQTATKNGSGFVVFDYQENQSFKYAGLDSITQKWVIGSYDASIGTWTPCVETPAGAIATPDKPYEITVARSWSAASHNATCVTLVVNGREVATYDFMSEDLGGGTGVGTRGMGATFGFYKINGRSEYSEDFSSARNTVLGIAANHEAYLPNGTGGYISGSRGECLGGGDDYYYHASCTREAYISLAWETGGAVWDVNRLRAANRPGGDPSLLASFSNAFSQVLAKQALAQYQGPQLIIDEDGISSTIVAGKPIVVPGVEGGITYPFTVTFVGDGRAHDFNMVFQPPGGGDPLGVIPIAVNAAYTYKLQATDPDGDTPLYFEWTEGSDNHGAQLVPSEDDANGAVISWNPTSPGAYEFSVTVCDGNGGISKPHTWTVVVQQDDVGLNHQPQITETSPPDAMVRRAWEFQVKATDDDVHDEKRYYLINNDVDRTVFASQNDFRMRIDRNTGVVTWTPGFDDGQAGVRTFWVLVSDGRGGEDTHQFTVTVKPQSPVNRPPIVDGDSVPPVWAFLNEEYVYDVNATDPDGDSPTYKLRVAPPGMGIDPDSGIIGWTPQLEDLDGYESVVVDGYDVYLVGVDVLIDDGNRGITPHSFTIQVAVANQLPTVDLIPDCQTGVGTYWSQQIIATDANGDGLKYYLHPDCLDLGMTIGESTGLIEWSEPAVGNITVTFAVDDGHGEWVVRDFVLAVLSATPPKIEGSIPAYWIVNAPDSAPFTVIVFSEIDAEDLEKNVTLDNASRTRGMSLTAPTSGTEVGDHWEYQYILNWTPRVVEEYVPVYVTAIDGDGVSGTTEVDIAAVAPVNPTAPPEIADWSSNPPGPAVVGQLWTLTMTADDPDQKLGESDPWFAITSFIVNGVERSLGTDPGEYSFVDHQDGTATLQWTPLPGDVSLVDTCGVHVKILLTDTSEACRSYDLDLPVVNSESTDAPDFVTHPMGPAYVNHTWTYEVQAIDPDGEPGDLLDYELDTSECPADMHLEVIDDPVRGRYARLTWRPETPTDPATLGQHVVINVTDIDDDNITVPQGFYLSVVQPIADNDPPDFKTPYLGPMTKDLPFKFQLDIDDPNGHDWTVALTDTTAPGLTGDMIASTGYIDWTPTAGGDFTITLTATDEYGVSSLPVTFPIHVFGNAAPTIQRGFAPLAFIGDAYEYAITISDPNPEDTIVVSLNDEAAAMGLHMVHVPATNVWTLTWDALDTLDTPEDYYATYPGRSLPDAVPLTIHVEDNHGASVNLAFPILPVFDPNDPNSPVRNETITIPAGREYKQQLIVQSAAGRTLTYQWDNPSSLPNGIELTAGGLITWTPTFEQAGELGAGGSSYVMPILVDDGIDPPATMNLTILVLRPEDFAPTPPVITSSHPTGATAGQQLVYEPTAGIVVNEATGATTQVTSGLTWSLGEKPSGMEINANTGRITWTPDTSLIGKAVTVELYVVNATEAGGVQTFTITVGANNQKPSIDAAFPKSCRAGTTLAYNVLASDPEGHALSYELLPGDDAVPADMRIDSQTGEITWDVPAGEELFVKVRVFEKYYPDSEIVRDLKLKVVGPGANAEPIILATPTGQSAPVGQPFSYAFAAYDADGELNFTWAIVEGDLGSHMSIDANGLFTWTPQEGEAGSHKIKVSVQDNPTMGFPITTYVTFTLTAVDCHPPIVDATVKRSAVAGATLNYQVEAFDPQDPTGSSLTYAIDYDHLVCDNPAYANFTKEDWQEELGIWPDSGLLMWKVPKADILIDDTELTVPIVVTGKYGAKTTQYLTISAAIDDTIAPTISARVVEVDGTGSIVRTLSPGEDLDVNGTYRLLVDVNDNSGAVWLDDPESNDQAPQHTFLTVVDVAAMQSEDYHGLGVALGYGYNMIDLYDLNQGNIHFAITVTDASENQTACDLTYHVADLAADPPARIDHLIDRDGNGLSLGAAITGMIDVWGVAKMLDPEQLAEYYCYELMLYRADAGFDKVIPLLDENGDPVKVEGSDTVYQFMPGEEAKHVVIASGTANSDNLVLGTIDPTLYASGLYRLVLAVKCNEPGHPHYKAIDERLIEIRNDAKPGNLDLSFTDLKVDLGGIPVSLVRSYSSANVELSQSDFGPGWTLGLLAADVQVAHFQHGGTSSLQDPMARGTRIMVTLPDGSVQRFTFDPVECGSTGRFQPYFRPDPDVTSTLEIADLDENLRLVAATEQAEGTYQGCYTDPNTNLDFIPRLFGSALRLRTAAGVDYLYDPQSGKITSIQDDTGRRVDISVDGLETTIFASSGNQTIVVTRDTNGRITQITDPSGEHLTYAYGDYNAAGQDQENTNYTNHDVLPPDNPNLGMVTFRDGTHVVYQYDEYLNYPGNAGNPTPAKYAHHLTEIDDNVGIAVLTAKYDSETEAKGRLTALIDAGGHQTNLTFELTLWDGRKLSTVTDSSDPDKVIEEIRDRLGNVLRRIEAIDDDPVTHAPRYLATEYRYDNLTGDNSKAGLLTDESLPFVITGDEERLNTYEELTNPPTIWVRHIGYDSRGRITSSSDALDQTTYYEYDEQDRLIATTDPSGNVTHNVYDSYTGNLLETYVTEGIDNPSHPKPKLNHTRYIYDGDGDLTATYQIDVDGNETVVSLSTYDEDGRVASTTDASNVITYFVYDWNGNQTHTWYNWLDPDGVRNAVTLVSLTIYDDNDCVTGTAEYELTLDSPTATITDFAVLETAIGSATAISTTSTNYNDRGQVEETVDQFGKQTWNFYDTRGLLIETLTQAEDSSVTPAVSKWLVARTIYDNQGQAIYTTDPFVIDYFEISGTASYTPVAAIAAYGTHTVYDSLGRATTTERVGGLYVEMYQDAQEQWETRIQSGHTPTVVSSSETYYTDEGRIDYTVDEYDAQTEYTYDPLGRQIETRSQSKDENGDLQWVATRTIYDSLGRVWITSDPFIEQSGSMPAWSGTQTTYDSLGRAVETEHLEGLVISINPTTQEVTWTATSVTWSTETVYNNLGQVFQSIGRHAPQGNSESDATYSARLLTVQIGPVVKENGDLVRLRTETHYGSEGMVDYTKTNIRVVVNSQGVVQSTNDANAQTTHYQYDAYGRTVKTVYTDGSYVSQGYDQYGRKTSESYQTAGNDSNPLLKVYGYDDFGRLVSVTLPEVTAGTPVYEYGYDTQGNQTLIRDPLGHETRYTYDAQGHELSRTLPLGFGPDGIQNTTDDSTLPEGNFTEQKFYDAKGRLDYEVSFEGVVVKYIYDDSAGAGGRLAEKRFFTSVSAYDSGNGTPSEVWTYTYDAFGREHEVSQQAGAVVRTTTTTYDAQGCITKIASPEGTVNYVYNPVTGLRERMFTGTVANPIEDTHYTFDALGRLATVEVYERNGVVIDTDAGTAGNQPETTRYGYDLLGNLRREQKANGVVSDYVYDSLNRLDVLTEFADNNANGVYDSGDQLLTQFDYSLRADGKRSSAVEKFWFDDNSDSIAEMHQNTMTWSYDDLGRLIDEVFDHYDNALDQTEHFVLDLVGNRQTQTLDKGNNSTVDETTDYAYDANDRLITESLDTDGQSGYERVTMYGYDHTQENLKEVREGGVLQTKTEYTYDYQDMMQTAKVTTYTSGTASRVELSTYKYDASGIRVSALLETDSTADGTYETRTKTEYLNDPQNETGYSQVLVETTTDATTSEVQKRVVYTIGSGRIDQTTTTYSGGVPQTTETLTFGRDGHDSTRVLYNMLGSMATIGGVRQLFSYDGYGNAIGFNPSLAGTSFLYNCEQRESTGLSYFRRRYYDPNTGRLNPTDPATGNANDPQSLHKYLFTPSDPINFNDPSGQTFIDLLLGAADDLAEYGISLKNGMAVLGAMDRLQTAIDIGQMVIQVAATGTVNPIQLASVAYSLIPGSALLKGIKVVTKPLGRLTNFTGKLAGSSAFLSAMARDVDEIGVNIYKNVSGSWAKAAAVSTRFVERIGEMGGGLVAQRLGLKQVEGFVKQGVHGFDGIFQKGNKFFILEAKGGVADLATGQMSQKWIRDNIQKLPEGLRRKLDAARKQGRLFGIVTKTPIDKATGAIVDPEYAIKHFDQIGGTLW